MTPKLQKKLDEAEKILKKKYDTITVGGVPYVSGHIMPEDVVEAWYLLKLFCTEIERLDNENKALTAVLDAETAPEKK